MLTERTSQLLSSYDIELVRLGTILLKNEAPRREWKRILSEYRKGRGNEGGNEEVDYFFEPLPKWDFEILENNDIEIKEIYGFSGTSGFMNYTIYTGSGGMNVIESAIKDYLQIKQKQIENGNKQKTKQKTNGSANITKLKSRQTRTPRRGTRFGTKG